jgi:hypothetical protein
MMLSHPVRSGEAAYQSTIQAAHVLPIDVFDAGIPAQFGVHEPPLESLILLPTPMMVDNQPQPFFKAELACPGIFHLFAHSVGHAGELERMKFVDGWLYEHEFSFLRIQRSYYEQESTSSGPPSKYSAPRMLSCSTAGRSATSSFNGCLSISCSSMSLTLE